MLCMWHTNGRGQAAAKTPAKGGMGLSLIGIVASVSDDGNLMVRSALLRASRTMGRGAILRDASQCDAPQDEGLPRGQPAQAEFIAFFAALAMTMPNTGVSHDP